MAITADIASPQGAQILRDLGVTSIRHLTTSQIDYKGLSGFGIEIVGNEHLEGT